MPPDPAAIRRQLAWRRAITGVLAEPEQIRVVFQPIADLARGTVAGYETLARIDAPVPGIGDRLSPDQWFGAAEENGLGPALEGVVIARALTRLDDLPPNAFLTVNVSPHLLGTPELDEAFASVSELSRVVVELTEHVAFGDLESITTETRRLRSAGALIAVDDAGSGYAGLQQILELRPQLVKLDRALVAGADRDPARAALAELLGQFAGRLDAWLLAEGIETVGELATFCRMGVPLGQGWLLGRPADEMLPLADEVRARVLAETSRVAVTDAIASVMISKVTVTTADRCDSPDPQPEPEPLVIVDRSGSPVEMVAPDPRDGVMRKLPVSLRVLASDAADDVLLRALTRSAEHRFDPVVCTDSWGQVIGIALVDELTRHVVKARAEDH
ncbi:EAL domain-containing protein [Cryptosporangium phraense]|uniref:EAL domain-containing protein n=2 Tax=Cryptosporangium phraense TaxID=2593070 RepID=A0A545AZD8_9ACTN|nr:EAL domain-containing protein [Cryptosporangium phraense]